MGKRLIKDSTLGAIADSIRTMGGAAGSMTPAEMPGKILNIPVNTGGSGVELPELSNPAGSGQILSGYEAISGSGVAITGSHVCPTAADLTKDATASPEQVAEGVTFYAQGEKREGTVYTVGSNLNEFGDLSASDDRITLATSFSDPTLFPAGTKHNVRAYLSNFGDATAADVAEGKTFTSVDGLKVVGTAVAKTITSLEVISVKNTAYALDVTGYKKVYAIFPYNTNQAQVFEVDLSTGAATSLSGYQSSKYSFTLSGSTLNIKQSMNAQVTANEKCVVVKVG